jgi:2,3-bisphosphoglycerate-dependent phosphoglycerate mutase
MLSSFHMNTLVLIRHGQSQWNLENRFTGWTDVPLTEQGKKDAATSGNALKEFSFNQAFTSRLQRAQQTLSSILQASGQSQIPVIQDSALNERHYGDLQGLNKAETAEKYGQEQVRLWRRSYATRPPNGESMEDCEHRTLPFFKQYVLPHVEAGQNIIVAAHGNSLRPIMKFLDNLDPDAAASMEIGLCTPYVYWFDSGKLVKKEVREVEGIVTQGASTTEATVKG